MGNSNGHGNRGAQIARGILVAGIVAWGDLAAAQGWQLHSNFTLTASLALKETFDSNVYLQDAEPDPAVTTAARPFQESWVTSVTPQVGFAFRPCSGFNMSANYAPEVVTFHDEPSESHVAHRAGLLFNGIVGVVNWQIQNSLTWIDGSEEGLTFGGPGGAPAIGGIPIRDRRAALIYRNSFGAFHKHGDWFFRPAVSSYIHDFKTEQRDPKVDPFYQNYVDRNDFNLGLDAGYQVFQDGYLFLAYRCGWQHENNLPPGTVYDYSNDYQRFLVGFEGKVTSWLKFNLFIGPDWRNFNHLTPPGFDPDPVLLFVDASMVITLTKNDTLIVTVKQFEQPAFGTPSAYADITYDVTWRHVFNSKLAATAGFRAYGGEWEPPVRRKDWIFTPSVALAYKYNPHWSADLAYSYDWVDSLVPNTAGREFTRNLLSLGIKYTF